MSSAATSISKTKPFRLSISAKEAITCLENKTISSKDIQKICVKRSKNLAFINAFTNILSLEEIEEASSIYNIDYSETPLKGLPIAIKDNYCLRGHPTSCSSRMLATFKPPYNATLVERLLRSGAAIIGKTNMDEFAMGSASLDSSSGSVVNPWTLADGSELCRSEGDSRNLPDWYIAGGSSGGSGAAVAAFMCYAALGSDTGGSTRNPAARCGVVGFKPSYGLLSRHGLIPLVNSLDVPGIVTRTVDDSAMIFELLKGFDPFDSTSLDPPFNEISTDISDEDIRGLRIGIPFDFHPPSLDDEVRRSWQMVADLFTDVGARVEQVRLPLTQYASAVYSIMASCEIASNMARYDGLEFGYRDIRESVSPAVFAATREIGFNSVVRHRILAGNYFLLKENHDKYLVRAQIIRRLISDELSKLFNRFDLIVTPTVSEPHHRVSDYTDTRTCEEDALTISANMAGIPAISLPCCLSNKMTPIGVQLMAARFNESLLLSVSKWLEDQLEFPGLKSNIIESIAGS